MEEHLKIISEYLPLGFMDEETSDFVKYLSDAYMENVENGKFQFAFTAFHMLNMIFIYKVQWFLKEQGNADIEQALENYIRQNSGASFNTLFDLSQVPEKTSLEKLLKALSFHINDIDICKNHVGVRNNCSHASGKVYYKTQAKIEHYIEEELEYIAKVEEKLKPSLAIFLENFLKDNWDKSLLAGNISSVLREKYFSEKDLELLANVDVRVLSQRSDTEENIYQKILYLIVIFEIQKNIESEDNLLLSKLPIIMNGLTESVEVARDGDSVSMLSSSIIEEQLSPLISNFSDADREAAESILSYS
jgi:hypothetical protein